MVAPSKSPYDKHTSNPLSAHTGSACAAHLRAGHRAARRACVRGTWNPQYLTWQKGVVYGKYYPRWIRGNAVFRGETGVRLCSPRRWARSPAASSAEPAHAEIHAVRRRPAGFSRVDRPTCLGAPVLHSLIILAGSAPAPVARRKTPASCPMKKRACQASLLSRRIFVLHQSPR